MAHPKGTPTVFAGTRFRSQAEAAVAEDLTFRGVMWEYESERVFYEIPHTYTPDFVLPEEETITGEPIYVEHKGWLRAEDKRKLLAVRTDNPGMDLRILLQRGETAKGKPTADAKWCNRQGFKWAHRRVPDSWLRLKERQSNEA
ncbi:MAG: hypothetical protein ACYTFQ_00265 [Planctomycetota bacterium]|jgi:hypothetical protein